jgi:hypothetical protein
VNFQVGLLDALAQILGGLVRWPGVEDGKEGLDGGAAGHAAVGVAAHAIGQDAKLAMTLRVVVGDQDVVLVLFAYQAGLAGAGGLELNGPEHANS